jgi:hypothetical protein
MTNSEALELVRQVLNAYAMRSSHGDEEFERSLRDTLFGWSIVPQLEGIGEVLAKAWLETSPHDARARAAVIEHLTGIGKAEEALAIEGGAAPEPIGTASEAETNRTKENLMKSGRALGLLDPDKRNS